MATLAGVKSVVAGGLLVLSLACAGPVEVRRDERPVPRAPAPAPAARVEPVRAAEPAPKPAVAKVPAPAVDPALLPVATQALAEVVPPPPEVVPVEPRALESAIEVGPRVVDRVPVGLERREPAWDGAVMDRRASLRPDFVARTLTCDAAVRLARMVASRHGLEPGLILGVMRVESGFVENIISYATAVGLMQVMPASGQQKACGDLFDAEQNAECGARILAAFLKYYKGSVTLALSGYNAGHGMPDRARKETRTPRNFQYVEDVLRVRARWLRHGCREWE